MRQLEQKIITKPNISRRILAGIIDYSIIYLLVFLSIFIFGTPNNEGEYELSGVLVIIPITIWVVLIVGLESGMGGTIGNSLVGLKVIPDSGKNRNLTFTESLKRHMLDQLDIWFFGLVGILTIKNTEKHQRLGDLWAGTIVVKMNTLIK
ncbi:RDD family protein [Aquimarina rhabdastrellae]